jgi:hypothetical protein
MHTQTRSLLLILPNTPYYTRLRGSHFTEALIVGPGAMLAGRRFNDVVFPEKACLDSQPEAAEHTKRWYDEVVRCSMSVDGREYHL